MDGKTVGVFLRRAVLDSFFNKDFLGNIPIHQDLRKSAEDGSPLIISKPEHEISKLFIKLAEQIKKLLNL